MQGHYRNWKEKGKLPSKYNNPKYPEGLVRSVSFKLSLMAKQKAENCKSNINDNNNNSSSMKEHKIPRNEKSSLSFSPSPISSPSVQTIKCNSKSSSTKNLPISPNDIWVNFRFPLNINHPYKCTGCLSVLDTVVLILAKLVKGNCWIS